MVYVTPLRFCSENYQVSEHAMGRARARSQLSDADILELLGKLESHDYKLMESYSGRRHKLYVRLKTGPPVYVVVDESVMPHVCVTIIPAN